MTETFRLFKTEYKQLGIDNWKTVETNNKQKWFNDIHANSNRNGRFARKCHQVIKLTI